VLDLAGRPAEEGRTRARELLDYLEVGHRAKVKPALLSGGEAQRVAIARALANRPRIILADEPTAALDGARAGLVMDLMRKLAVEQEACIVTVTHDEKIFDRFDRLIHLRDGPNRFALSAILTTCALAVAAALRTAAGACTAPRPIASPVVSAPIRALPCTPEVFTSPRSTPAQTR
jgi:energy-coupling factor transporter ATP-binding protein EcfA2